MKRIFVLIPLSLVIIMCSNFTSERSSMENIKLSVNGLKKAYLDTAHTGVTLEILFYDPLLDDRDSVKFYSVELQENFELKGELKRMNMVVINDTLLRNVVNILTIPEHLPYSVLYEVGAVYMSPPLDDVDLEWELDTVINEYFTFRVYGDQKEYQHFVDSFGLEPTVFVRE